MMMYDDEWYNKWRVWYDIIIIDNNESELKMFHVQVAEMLANILMNNEI